MSNRYAFMAVGASAVAFLAALSSLPGLLELVRVGALRPLVGLCTILAAVLLLGGGALAAFRKRAAVFVLGGACAFAILALLSWPTLYAVIVVFFAAVGFAAALRL